MDCPRCHGLMISQFYEDLEDDTGRIHLSAWRCVNCGEVVDPVILKHRLSLPKPMVGRARLKTPLATLKLREFSREDTGNLSGRERGRVTLLTAVGDHEGPA
jgi:hypothetical protein